MQTNGGTPLRRTCRRTVGRWQGIQSRNQCIPTARQRWIHRFPKSAVRWQLVGFKRCYLRRMQTQQNLTCRLNIQGPACQILLRVHFSNQHPEPYYSTTHTPLLPAPRALSEHHVHAPITSTPSLITAPRIRPYYQRPEPYYRTTHTPLLPAPRTLSQHADNFECEFSSHFE